MRIPPQIIAEIRSAADILEVVSGYVSLKKKGQNYFGLCPFHTEKTPSFSVNTQKQIFHCFGCGEGGNSISFIMKIENLSFVEAAQFLARKYHIEIPESRVREEEEKARLALFDVNRFAADFFRKNLYSDAGKSARDYLQKRGFSDEIIEEFELGFALSGWDELIKAALKFGFSVEQLKAVGLVIPNKKGGYYDRFRERIIFPVHNLSGLVAGFGGRILKDHPAAPKYINSPETAIYQKGNILYGLFQHREMLRKRGRALLVEGYADVLALAQEGIQTAVASSGTSLTLQQARLLLRYSPEAVILYDGDLAGANAALRGIDVLLQEGLQVRVAVLPPGSDPDSFVKENGREALLELVEKSRELIDFKIYAFSSVKPLQTPQQQAELVNILAESVAEIHDEVVRNLYIQEIAKRLKLSETVVFRAVARKKRLKKQTQVEMPVPHDDERGARFQAERDVLEIALRFPPMLPVIYQYLQLNEFKFAPHRHIVTQIFEQYVNTGTVNPQHVLDYAEDGELQNFIAATMARKQEVVSEKILQRWTSDCIKNIKIDNLRQKVDQIREKIKRCESSGNNEELLTLSKKWTELTRRIEEIKNKAFSFEE